LGKADRHGSKDAAMRCDARVEYLKRLKALMKAPKEEKQD
jgi:hypothetical protein